MKVPDDTLFTPIYVKSRRDMTWPDTEKAFYLLTGSGLFLCRNHQFFQSCVPVRDWPSELVQHESGVRLNYPKVSRRLFERVVGFFDKIGRRFGAEAGVLLAWDSVLQRVQVLVPDQVGTVGRSSWTGESYPIGLHYESPTTLPPNLTLFGDIHSHVDEPAYASGTDKWDERYRAGLHIVVGRLGQEPPELHSEAVVDGVRFPVEPDAVIAGYHRRSSRVPLAWLEKVKVEPTWRKSAIWSWNDAPARNGNELDTAKHTASTADVTQGGA